MVSNEGGTCGSRAVSQRRRADPGRLGRLVGSPRRSAPAWDRAEGGWRRAAAWPSVIPSKKRSAHRLVRAAPGTLFRGKVNLIGPHVPQRQPIRRTAEEPAETRDVIEGRLPDRRREIAARHVFDHQRRKGPYRPSERSCPAVVPRTTDCPDSNPPSNLAASTAIAVSFKTTNDVRSLASDPPFRYREPAPRV